MRNEEKLFSEGNITKVLIKFSVPAILSLLVTELYNMVDTVFVGNAVGPDAIGALVIVFPIQRIVAALSLMFAIGASTSVARRNGEKNELAIKKTIENALSITFVSVMIFTALAFVFRVDLLRLLGASDALLPLANEYMGIIIFGSIFICLTAVMNYVMMCLGNRKITIISTATGAIMNVIVDAILVLGFDMGVEGAAIATLLSQIVAFCLSLYVFRGTAKQYNVKFSLRMQKAFVFGIIAVGFSSFIVEAEDGILMAFFNNLLLHNVGDEGVVVLGIISKVSMIMFITMLGIGSGMQPIAAYNKGAQNYERLRKVLRTTVFFALVTSTVLWLVTVIFAPQIMSIFVTDAALIAESVDAFRTMVSVFPIISIYYVTIYYYQAIGEGRASFVISIVRQLMVMLPVAILLVKVFHFGAYGVWLSYPIADVVSGVVAILLIRQAMKQLDHKIEKQSIEKTKEKQQEEAAPVPELE